MQNGDPAIRHRAVVAAGRIGDPLAAASLAERLHDPTVEVRRAAALALGFIGAAESSQALISTLDDPDPLTRGRASEALSRIGAPPAGALIAAAFRKALPPTVSGVLRIRGDDPGRIDDPWVELRLHVLALARLKDAEALASAVLDPAGTPVVDWWAPVWAAMRIGDERLLSLLMSAAGSNDPYIRSLAVRGLGKLKDPAAVVMARRLAEDPDPAVILQALRALALMGAITDVSSTVALHVDSPNLSLRREALLALSVLPSNGKWRARVIDNVGHADPWIRSAAWPALIHIDSEDVGLVLSMIGPDADFRVRQSVATALAENLGERAGPLLLPMLEDDDPRVIPSVLSALTRALKLGAAPTLVGHAESSDPGIRASVATNLSWLEETTANRFTEALSRAYETSLSDHDLETCLTVVDALSRDQTGERIAILRRVAGSDAARVVRQRALLAIGGGFAPPEKTALRMADARRLVSVYEPWPVPLYSPRAIISTRYGSIELSLDLVDAPLTTMSFVRLAQAGFFNGLSFHRVVPGFVVQGGDPRGDGYGGPGGTIRCEDSGRPFGRGSVGMALAGKDTGGSQFFITLEPQPHLDGLYPLFGEVISGMDIVDKIRPGDIMERVEVFDGRESL